MKQYVFLLGTGRCGTKSVVQLLNHQNDVVAKHETFVMPWDVDLKCLAVNIAQMGMESSNTVAESASYFLPYVDHIIDIIPTSKIVCLERDRDEVINSFDGKSTNRNHWTDKNCFIQSWNTGVWQHDPKWDQCFPKFPVGKKEAIGLYWDYYHHMSTHYQWKYPSNFKKFSINMLNDSDMMIEFFKFIGIDDYNIVLNMHANKDGENTPRHVVQAKSEITTIDTLNPGTFMKRVMNMS